MKLRILTGVLAAISLILLFYLANSRVMLLLFMVMAVWAYSEFDRIFFPQKSFVRVFKISLMINFTMVILSYDMSLAWVVVWCCFCTLAIWHVVYANITTQMNTAAKNLAYEFLGYMYILGIFGFVIPIFEMGGPSLILLLAMIIFVGDTAAYFVGKSLGKRKLAINLSPKKTIEGALANLLASVIILGVWLQWINPNPFDKATVIKLIFFTPVVNFVSQFGDLLESLFKRSHSQKDSGFFLPGHGGLLDRIDSVALASPIFYFYMRYVVF